MVRHDKEDRQVFQLFPYAHEKNADGNDEAANVPQSGSEGPPMWCGGYRGLRKTTAEKPRPSAFLPRFSVTSKTGNTAHSRSNAVIFEQQPKKFKKERDVSAKNSKAS
eukprot:RCo040768